MTPARGMQTGNSKAVVFDLGKVLVDFDYAIAARNLAARGRLTAPAILDFFRDSPWLLQYEEGLLDSAAFYEQVRQVTGYGGSREEFGVSFGDIFQPIEPMIQLHAELRQSGLPTYVFSNTNEFAIRHIRRHYPFFGHFDGYILSYERGAMKPDPRLYEVVEEVAGRSGRDIVYLDDRPENIATGLSRGWRAILQETPERSRQVLRAMGLVDQ